MAIQAGHNSPKCSLKYLSELYIPLKIDKNEDIQTGNWDQIPLTTQQIKYTIDLLIYYHRYASEDAYCSYKLIYSLYDLYLTRKQ